MPEILDRKKRSWIVACCAPLLFSSCATAPRGAMRSPETAQQITRAGALASTAGPTESFTGRVRVDPLFSRDDHLNASGAYVTFEAGALSAWHSHPAGQRLVVTSGVGLTQQWNKPAQAIGPGDVVSCPPGVKHWHGAAPTSSMTHLAVSGAVDGKSVTWMEKVTDEHLRARQPRLAEPRAGHGGRAGRHARRGAAAAFAHVRQPAGRPDRWPAASPDRGAS